MLSIKIDNNRIYGLDILRFLAIFFVIFAHASDILPEKLSKIHQKILPFDGVTIFFVLSGFLIGGILIKIINRTDFKTKDLINFWTRRWMRTLPAYYFTLLLLILPRFVLDAYFGIKDFWKHLFFLQNVYNQKVDFFPESWSLTVEEWFYLAFPFSLYLLFKLFNNKKAVILYTIISFILFSIYIRFHIYQNNEIIDSYFLDSYIRKVVITRLDSLMFGVLGAYFAFYHQNLWLKHKNTLFYIAIFSFILISIIIPGTPNAYLSIFYFTLISFSTLLSLPFLSTLKNGSGKIYKAVTITSIISYSLYLLNFSFLREFVIDDIIHNKIYSPLQLTITVTTCIDYFTYWVLLYVLSVCMYKYIERPMMNLRDKITK